MSYKKKLIEVALPLEAINRESAREKSIRHGHPSTLHLWWARRPLAAARAVLWSSLVDDPSAHPDRFPTEEAQEEERQRLFRILEQLVLWENSNNKQVLAAARAEIVASCDGELPNILDPFCGGGTIPLEAQRLGLPAYGGDLNPVAVLISKAMVEIPPRFAGRPPVHPPEAGADLGIQTWERAQGLAEDIRYYGKWLRDRAFERIGHLYPKITLPAEQGGGEATVIAWIWARTIESPDPSWNGHVPLVRSWVLRKAIGKKPVVWVDPLVDRETQAITYEVREGGEPPAGTVTKGRARCLATGSAIDLAYVDQQANSSGFGLSCIAVVADVGGRKGYASVDSVQDAPSEPIDLALARLRDLGSIPDEPSRGTFGGTTERRRYGFHTFDNYFTSRQLVALGTLVELLPLVHAEVLSAPGWAEGDSDSQEGLQYADAIATYLALGIDKCVDYWSTLAAWHSGREVMGHTFTRQSIPMVWDFAEANPFSTSSGNLESLLSWVTRVVEALPASQSAVVYQRIASASLATVEAPVVATDPPYYDNISYADLSDFFYVWMRRSLRSVWPDLLSTFLTPKADELIASRSRHGSMQTAYDFFESGIRQILSDAARYQNVRFPLTMFYAFKQAEKLPTGLVSTGWETFLTGMVDSGLQITATWPVRTEMQNRSVAMGTAALASSIVIACRPRSATASLATRSEYLQALRTELPDAIRLLQKEAIAPVDMAQSAIGPGMAVFSRYSKVLETDGSAMPVRQALVLINQVLEEVLSDEETEFDAATRWALTWYQQHGMNHGAFGDAETLAKAKGTSVAAVVTSGVAEQRGGKAWLVDRAEMPDDWDPRTDRKLTVWEVTQHLIARLDSSETDAADLLRSAGSGLGEQARQLAYLLYQVADKKGWAKEAVAYNGLIQAWPTITQLATGAAPSRQGSML